MITINDLEDQTGKPGPHLILFCGCCGGEYSANRSDYFWATTNYVFKCCDKPLELVKKQTVYEPVKK